MLSGEGMSTRAIATVVGASPATVKRDLTSGGSHEPPDKPITGVDGKVYPPAAQPSVTGVAYEGSTASRLFFERLGKLEYLHEELALRAQKLGPDSEEDAETRSCLRHSVEAQRRYMSMAFDAILDGLDGRPLRTRMLACAMKGEDRRQSTEPTEPEAPSHGVTKWSHTVQQVSAEVPMDDLTDEEVEWLGGAAQFLYHYTVGELTVRRGGRSA